MFQHVVLLDFGRILRKKEVDFIEDELRKIRSSVSGLKYIEFKSNLADRHSGMRYGFTGKFVDESSHKNYQEASVHKPLKKFIAEIAKKIIAFDCEL